MVSSGILSAGFSCSSQNRLVAPAKTVEKCGLPHCMHALQEYSAFPAVLLAVLLQNRAACSYSQPGHGTCIIFAIIRVGGLPELSPGSGWMLLPLGFFRLVFFRLARWHGKSIWKVRRVHLL